MQIYNNACVISSAVKHSKCVLTDDWKMPNFDDSDWPIATEVGSNGDSPWGTFNHVNANAKWLWVPDWRNHRTIYCRVTLGEIIAYICI